MNAGTAPTGPDVEHLLTVEYPAENVFLVMDNLNTHNIAPSNRTIRLTVLDVYYAEPSEHAEPPALLDQI